MSFTAEETKELGKQGYASIGRTPKIAYYTPDGRRVMALPDMRTYSNDNGGGVRDANFDRGWLADMPSELKPYCPHCDLWHDTEKGVTECGRNKKTADAKWQKKAKKELQKESGRLDKLEGDMGEIKDLLQKLLKR